MDFLAPPLLALAAASPAPGMDHDMAMDGFMTQVAGWHVMAHGLANFAYDHQGGPRGGEKRFGTSMLMTMASRPLGGGSLQISSMLSLDPLMGPAGYPLLLQTGETADGRTHLIDRQHPHDAFMELAATYGVAAGSGEAFVSAGLPGEAALGPTTFMHRFSGERIPEAPLTHHWLDSTHVTMGVVTVGTAQGPWKLEASAFNGREPDERRWNIETRGFDSWSARATYTALPGLAFQASYGYLASPEALEPDVHVRRTTASATWNAGEPGSRRGATLAWGRNDKRLGGESVKLDGWLAETTLELSEAHTVFARAEHVRNDELFPEGDPLAGQPFGVGKLSVGYLHDFARTGMLRWSVGALASAYRIPAALEPVYGAHPRSYMLFLQVRL
jgi:hypothetical protein